MCGVVVELVCCSCSRQEGLVVVVVIRGVGGGCFGVFSDLGQTHTGQLLLQGLHPLQGLLGVEHWNPHHGGLDAGAGDHQDLPQPEWGGEIVSRE